jgi:hypothetical protein
MPPGFGSGHRPKFPAPTETKSHTTSSIGGLNHRACSGYHGQHGERRPVPVVVATDGTGDYQIQQPLLGGQ